MLSDILVNHPDYDELQGYISDDNEEVVAELEEPFFEPDFSCHVILDGIPPIPKAKEEKLRGVLMKLIDQLGEGYNITFPFNEEGMGDGFCFLSCPSSEAADLAVKVFFSHFCYFERNHHQNLIINRNLMGNNLLKHLT